MSAPASITGAPCSGRCRRRPRCRRRGRAGRSRPQRAIFGTTPSMNRWPPKPGLTVISSTMSRSPSTRRARRAAWRVQRHAGLLAEARDLLHRAVQVRQRLDVHADEVGARAREVLEVALGLAIMRWTSRGSLRGPAHGATTSGPMVMFGTKWPSMTSTWTQSAPRPRSARTSSPRRAKSAERIEGAIRRGRFTVED